MEKLQCIAKLIIQLAVPNVGQVAIPELSAIPVKTQPLEVWSWVDFLNNALEVLAAYVTLWYSLLALAYIDRCHPHTASIKLEHRTSDVATRQYQGRGSGTPISILIVSPFSRPLGNERQI